MHCQADFAPPALCATSVAILTAATVAIVARIADPLHGGLGIAIPGRLYASACGITLALAVGTALTWCGRYGRNGAQMRLRALIERDTRFASAEGTLKVGWTLMGVHAALSVLG